MTDRVARLEAAEARVRELQDQGHRAETGRQKAVAELAQLLKQHESLKKAAADHLAAGEVLEAEVPRLTAALAAAERAFQEHAAESQRRGYALGRAEQKLAAYDDQMAAREEETGELIAAAEADRAELVGAYEHVKACMHTAEDRATKAERDLAALRDTLAAAVRDWERDAATLAVNETARANAAEQKLAAALAAAEEKAIWRQSQLDDERNENGILKDQLAAAEARVRELEKTLELLRMNCSETLLQKVGKRSADMFEAAHKACVAWETVPSRSLHEIRAAMRALREVLNRGPK